jgi:putative inorganic carbon (hco3(-)) transporter
VTADRSGSQSLHAAPPVLASTAHRAPRLLTQIAETVTRYGLPVFILCLPLEFTSTFLRLQLARIVLIVVGVAFVYLLVAGERKLLIPRGSSVFPLALYVAVSIASWLFTRAPGSLNPLLDVAAYPLMALLVVNLARTEQQQDNAWTAFLVSGLAIALLGAFLYYADASIWRPDLTTPLHRVNATFADPNILARFLTLAVGAAILMFAARRQNRWLVIATAMAGAAVLPLTFSKSGYLFFPVSLVLAAILGAGHRRAALIALATIAIFAGAILVNPATRDRSMVVVETITGTSQNVVQSAQPADAVGSVQLDSVRSYLINAGWQMFKDHPLFGIGYGGFQHSLLTEYKRFLPQNQPVTLSHTSAVTILSEQGAVGAGLLLAFLLLLAWEAIRAMRRRTPWRDLIVTPAFLIVPILLFSQLEGRLIEEPYLWLAIGLVYSAGMLERSIRTVRLPR